MIASYDLKIMGLTGIYIKYSRPNPSFYSINPYEMLSVVGVSEFVPAHEQLVCPPG